MLPVRLRLSAARRPLAAAEKTLVQLIEQAAEIIPLRRRPVRIAGALPEVVEDFPRLAEIALRRNLHAIAVIASRAALHIAAQRIGAFLAALATLAGLFHRLADLPRAFLQTVERLAFGLLRRFAFALLQRLSGLAHGAHRLAQRGRGLSGGGVLFEQLLQLFFQLALGLLIGLGAFLATALLRTAESAVEQAALLVAQFLQLLQALPHLLGAGRHAAIGGKLAEQAAQRLQALLGGIAGTGMGEVAHLIQHGLQLLRRQNAAIAAARRRLRIVARLLGQALHEAGDRLVQRLGQLADLGVRGAIGQGVLQRLRRLVDRVAGILQIALLDA